MDPETQLIHLSAENLVEKHTAGPQIVATWAIGAAAAGVLLVVWEPVWSWSCRVAPGRGFIQSAGRPAQARLKNLRSSGENLAVSMPGAVVSVLSPYLLMAKVASQPRMRMNGGGPLKT